ncbi:DUF6431 domain-containing protein [Papillibacter cinnamivorans]|uniref:DUF6431 domain-containing protein n=1 Tax=Papillibacter cinnamivorans DSM 12816 TaxID=1122930 RepID=A0A1W2AKI8_9FIRM|nr:hypothetical protein SAMN02745168_1792 [Papillibacter cinnamivorans DSM 12816]
MFFVRSRENVSCPICGGQLLHRDRVIRTFRESDGERKRLSIRRLVCAECRRLHRELPDFIVPFKHYVCDVIEAAIEAIVSDISADDCTIQRWRHWFRRSQVHFWGVLCAAAATVGKPPPQPPDRSGSLLRSIQGHLQVTRNWLHRLVRITVNSQNWVCTEFAWVTGE